MSSPNNFFNFESSSDSPNNLPSQVLMDFLNSCTPQGALINAPDSASGNIPQLPLSVDQLPLLPVHRPIAPPSSLNIPDDLLDMLTANAPQLADAALHDHQRAEANGAASATPELARTISDVTMDMLHRTPFATVAIKEADGSISVPNVFVGNGKQAQAPSTMSAIPIAHQANLTPAPPHQQAVNASQYGANGAAVAPPNGLVVPDGECCAAPPRPGDAHAGIRADAVEVKRLQAAEQTAPQAVAEPREGAHSVAAGHLRRAGVPSGTLQAAKKNNGERSAHGARGKGARGGAVVRRVLKRMAKRKCEAPDVLSRLSEEQSRQESGDGAAEEKRGKKRKAEGAENEEELKKLRRVRNRESVEKCRAKQRMRLEKLEEEDKALRSECELMRQMAEVFQEKWKRVAEEYHKICGKDAGECPLVIPPSTKLPEVATLSAGDGN